MILAKLKKNEKGFTLIEVLVALAIVSLVVVAFLMAMGTAHKATFISNERTTAESLARSQMEYVKNQAYAGTYLIIATPSNYEIVSPIAVLELQTGLQKITVTIQHQGNDVALAITGLLASGLGMTIFQIFSGNAQSSNQMTVVRQVQNAGYWISQDTLMALLVTPSGATGFPLTLTWAEFGVDEDEHQVVYTLVGDQLKREHYTNRTINPDPDATTFIAQYIDSISCQFAGGELTLTVSASVGGYRPASETRTYEVVPRPSA
jgi:prepilin-type N-terminal cleavage/methylation domain-containing protein